jgi:hypothetical protein
MVRALAPFWILRSGRHHIVGCGRLRRGCSRRLRGSDRLGVGETASARPQRRNRPNRAASQKAFSEAINRGVADTCLSRKRSAGSMPASPVGDGWPTRTLDARHSSLIITADRSLARSRTGFALALSVGLLALCVSLIVLLMSHWEAGSRPAADGHAAGRRSCLGLTVLPARSGLRRTVARELLASIRVFLATRDAYVGLADTEDGSF